MEQSAPLAISAIEHHEYCPRQCALIHADGVWEENRHTVAGNHGHRRVDGGGMKTERGKVILRAIPLWSEQLGLTGRADAVELHGDGSLVPVEYKMGVRHGRAADLQLCAQALCLEEMTGRSISHGFVWYSGPRRRHRVVFNDEIRRATADAIDAVKLTLRSGSLPVAVNDARCGQCQLIDHCLPGLTASGGASAVQLYLAREVYRCDS